jgi:hypothetical protein
MHVADKNMINLIDLYPGFAQTQLCAFTAIDQEIGIINL